MAQVGYALIGLARAVHDALWLTFVIDLPKAQVIAALKLGAARIHIQFAAVRRWLAGRRFITPLSNGEQCAPWLAGVLGTLVAGDASRSHTASLRHSSRLLLGQTVWFLVPMVLVMICGEAVIAFGFRLALMH